MTAPTTADKPTTIIDTTELANLRAELTKLRAERDAAHAMLDRQGIGAGTLVARIIELEYTAGERATIDRDAADACEWGAGHRGQGWGASAVGGGL